MVRGSASGLHDSSVGEEGGGRGGLGAPEFHLCGGARTPRAELLPFVFAEVVLSIAGAMNL